MESQDNDQLNREQNLQDQFNRENEMIDEFDDLLSELSESIKVMQKIAEVKYDSLEFLNKAIKDLI